MECAELLILQKKLYSETSLIIRGISRQRGRLDFLVRGALRYNRKKFPEIDLFRCFTIHFPTPRSELYNWREADQTADFSSLARSSDSYRTACWLARFSLLNTMAENPLPLFYQSLLTALARLVESSRLETRSSKETCCRAMATVLPMCVFLYENGVLPANTSLTREISLTDLLQTDKPRIKLNQITPEQWRIIYRQAGQWLEQNNFTVPRA